MNLIKPKFLKKGDTIGFLSVSGSIKDIDRLERAKHYFQKRGYNVVFSDTSFEPLDYLSSDDESRVRALEEFFIDDGIDAIFASRGGYGAIRIVDKINYNIIKENPKIFAGFSDITVLLAAIYKRTGLTTFHSPMPYSDFYQKRVSKFTAESFFSLLHGKTKNIKLNPDKKVYAKGKARGILWGGNLATLASLAGTDFVPDKDFILFLEEIDEKVYALDRSLTQLLNLKEFKKHLRGIVLGEFSGIDSTDYFNNFFTRTALELQIPVVSGLQIGHVGDKLTLPLGVQVELNASLGRIDFI